MPMKKNQEELSILNIYAQIKGTHIHKRNFTKAQSTYCTSHKIVGDFNTPLLLMGKLWKQIKQRHSETNNTVKLAEVMNQMDLTDIYRTYYPKTKEYTFFSAPH
jgi:exonuclease III